MKYTNTSRFPKFVGGMGFYAIIALCLLGIGAASWFAVSRYNAMDRNQSQSQQGGENAYTPPQSSYNSSTDMPEAPEPEASAKVENEVSDVPYSAPQTSSAPKKEKRSFMLPVDGNVLKGYSDSALQFSATHGDMRLHTGVDIVAADGADIKAAGSGNVTVVEDSASLGKTVTIDHGDGIIVKYCGLGSVNVKLGGKVSVGTVIGTLGTVPSECADQSHLHLEATVDGKVVSALVALGLE